MTGYIEDLDNEEHPRNACAIRTALILGAEFVQLKTFGDEPRWSIKGIDCICKTKTMPAFMYLIPFGIGITKDARACLLKDLHKENSK